MLRFWQILAIIEFIVSITAIGIGAGQTAGSTQVPFSVGAACIAGSLVSVYYR